GGALETIIGRHVGVIRCREHVALAVALLLLAVTARLIGGRGSGRRVRGAAASFGARRRLALGSLARTVAGSLAACGGTDRRADQTGSKRGKRSRAELVLSG